jgi:nucleoside-diphosphate-sugar epimerase
MDNSILLKDIPIEMFDGKTVLITGGSGLVGTHLLYAFDEMHEKGIAVDVLALGSSYYPPHLNNIFEKPFAKYSILDLATTNINPYFNEFDFIIHAATYGQPQRFMADPTKTIILNTSVTAKLLEKVPTRGRFLFISSSEVYSGLTVFPYKETSIGTSTPEHPRACYIESKRCGEAIVNAFRLKGTDAKSVRLCLAYGEGTRKGDKRALNMFIERALLNQEIVLMDAGQALRTYIYVGDAVNMILKILLQGEQSTYNVGGVSMTMIWQLASLIGELTGVDVVVPMAERGLDGAPNEVALSIDRYIKEFGERDFIPLRDGLKRTIKYQEKLYAEEIKKNNTFSPLEDA